MRYNFLSKSGTCIPCELCNTKTNLDIIYRSLNMTLCYKCLSDIYRSIEKQADYLEFKADQFENNLQFSDKPERTNTYFL